MPQNHLYNEVGLNMSIRSCKARELRWTNAENISKIFDWINTHQKRVLLVSFECYLIDLLCLIHTDIEPNSQIYLASQTV